MERGRSRSNSHDRSNKRNFHGKKKLTFSPSSNSTSAITDGNDSAEEDIASIMDNTFGHWSSKQDLGKKNVDNNSLESNLVSAQADQGGRPAERATTTDYADSVSSQLNNSSATSKVYFADPRRVLTLDSMAIIYVMPQDIAKEFVERLHWTTRKPKRPVHMGAVSHD